MQYVSNWVVCAKESCLSNRWQAATCWAPLLQRQYMYWCYSFRFGQPVNNVITDASQQPPMMVLLVVFVLLFYLLLEFGNTWNTRTRMIKSNFIEGDEWRTAEARWRWSVCTTFLTNVWFYSTGKLATHKPGFEIFIWIQRSLWRRAFPTAAEPKKRGGEDLSQALVVKKIRNTLADSKLKTVSFLDLTVEEDSILTPISTNTVQYYGRDGLSDVFDILVENQETD